MGEEQGEEVSEGPVGGVLDGGAHTPFLVLEGKGQN